MPFGMGPAGWTMWPYMAWWRGVYPPFVSPWFFSREEEKAFLENQIAFMEEQLARLRDMLEELERREKEKA